MAGIDKTYVTVEQYDLANDWLKKEVKKDTTGIAETIYVYDRGTILWNTSGLQDLYLAQKCKLDFIQARLKEQYSTKFVGFSDDIDLSKESFVWSVQNEKTEDSIFFGERVDENQIELYDEIVFYGTTDFWQVYNKAYNIFGYEETLGFEIVFEFFGLTLTHHPNQVTVNEKGEEVNICSLSDNFVFKPKVKHSYDFADIKDLTKGQVFISEKDNVHSVYDYETEMNIVTLLKRQIDKGILKHIKKN